MLPVIQHATCKYFKGIFTSKRRSAASPEIGPQYQPYWKDKRKQDWLIPVSRLLQDVFMSCL
jgi:hypothetical protein